MTLILAALALAGFVLSLVHFLRAEWYRQRLEEQVREFAAALGAETGGGHRPTPG